jgi:hypothetical protein
MAATILHLREEDELTSKVKIQILYIPVISGIEKCVKLCSKSPAVKFNKCGPEK